MKNQIKEKLTREFSPLSLTIKDESHLHKGHSGYKPGGNSHFSIIIVSESFCGLNRIKRHQMVYSCLAAGLREGIHALRLKTLCPHEIEGE